MAFHRSNLFILIAALAVTHSSCVNLTTLRLAQVVYRHGDRAPMYIYPTDPYTDVQKYWPNGLGQLTRVSC
ncbi:unnamed protein product [Allacma fusca]|uniref:Uncharacterized protein n=1 Tax=Allacma fusca TaxID=39272 RepID=A0A8J2PDT3_9HEXA|nr:unnamed protein product [Allacma fusca]